MEILKNISVLGAGTWGIALARMLANTGYNVTVWSALEDEITNLNATHSHPNLPGVDIPETIHFTAEIEKACQGMDIIVFAVPSTFIKSTAVLASPYITGDQIIVCVAKGIDFETLSTMTATIEANIEAKADTVALSGPTHAEEVSRDMPTAIVAASKNQKAAEIIQNVFMNDNMRVYTSPDMEGVELCGAMKNVIALAVGISSGLGFQDNAKAAIITRGMQEIKRLGLAMGCNVETFYGLAGIGDLIVTATSEHSRNNRCGRLIGQGLDPKEASKQIGMVVEGLNALPAAVKLVEKYGVDAPIVNALNEVVSSGKAPKEVALALMKRSKKDEILGTI